MTDVCLGRYCGEDEEHDPSEDYEEYLACAVCGDHGELSILFVLSFVFLVMFFLVWIVGRRQVLKHKASNHAMSFNFKGLG